MSHCLGLVHNLIPVCNFKQTLHPICHWSDSEKMIITPPKLYQWLNLSCCAGLVGMFKIKEQVPQPDCLHFLVESTKLGWKKVFNTLKGIVHPKLKILSFTHPHVVSDSFWFKKKKIITRLFLYNSSLKQVCVRVNHLIRSC